MIHVQEIARKDEVATLEWEGKPMERFIQMQNEALFRRKLIDPHTTEPERQISLKLLAEEEAKEIPQKKGDVTPNVERSPHHDCLDSHAKASLLSAQ
jgi:hypothetical protein